MPNVHRPSSAFHHRVFGRSTVVLLLTAGPLTAQRADSLAAGARVRVYPTAQEPAPGTLVRADSIGLTVRAHDGATRTYTWPAVHRVERYAGRESTQAAFERGARRGALLGVALTTVGFAIAAYSDARHPCEGCGIFSAKGGTFLVGTFWTGILSMGGGAIATTGRDRWVRVPLPQQ